MQSKYYMIRYLFFIFAVAFFHTGHAQVKEQGWFANEIYGGYGIFSFYKVENPQLYSKVESSGLAFAGYTLKLDADYSIGLLFGYEALIPIINNSPQSFYVNRSFAMARLKRTLVRKKHYSLYISALAGLNREEKKLADDKGTDFEPVYDVVFIGFETHGNKNFKLFVETGYNRLSLLRCGAGFLF